jgi:hypothetical protein
MDSGRGFNVEEVTDGVEYFVTRILIACNSNSTSAPT